MKALRKIKKKISKRGKKTVKKGLGLFDKIIDKLPFEAHLPGGYNYCGPGTRLEKRLARGDKGINGLDELCKRHDIAYANNKDSAERYNADKELQSGALKRLFAKDASFGERAASLLVSTAMKAKTGLTKFGMGLSKSESKSKSQTKSKKKTCKRLKTKGYGVHNSHDNLLKDINHIMEYKVCGGVKVAKPPSKKKREKKERKTKSRIIKTPRIEGGILPILPILAGIGAIGSVIGSATNVARTLRDIKSTKDLLLETSRHNQAMERKGGGLYLRPYEEAVGKGLYLKPFSDSKNLR